MTLEQLSKKIKTTTDLRSIVGTMKMLSSVSILQYEKALVSVHEYAATLEDAFLALALNTGWTPEKQKQDSVRNRAVMILIGTDNGLVGGFNRDVIKNADIFIKEKHYNPDHIDTICVGRRLAATDKRTRSAAATFPISNSVKELTPLAAAVLQKIDSLALKHKIDAVFLAHNKKDGSKITTSVFQLMPMSYDWFETLKKQKWSGRMMPMMSAPFNTLLGAFSREYLAIILAKALTESLAGEHYARMLNMQQAEKNIDESLLQLDLDFQQARQNAITDELIDIVSGAESLTKQSSSKQNIFLTKDKKKSKRVPSKQQKERKKT